jgi:hypothetical protein
MQVYQTDAETVIIFKLSFLFMLFGFCCFAYNLPDLKHLNDLKKVDLMPCFGCCCWNCRFDGMFWKLSI